ncbi:MAG: AraC family transcriptional regulator [Tissierellia bacterium]|nr:AraC family transcriptional regulator [Tissierellia bacterium]
MHYLINSKDFEDFPFIKTKLMYLNIAKAERPSKAGSFKSPYTDFFYVISGSGTLWIDGEEEMDVKTNDLVILTSRRGDISMTSPRGTMKYMLIGLDGISIIEKMDLSINQNAAVKYNLNKADPVLKSYLKDVVRETSEKRGNYIKIVSSLIDAIIEIIAREEIATFYPYKAKKHSNECAYIKKYLDENYYEDITLDSLANLAYMNKYYLVHEFKKYTGTTPINYLIDRRLEKAKELILDSNLTMEEIAKTVGFNSQSYFNQIFKKKVNASPSMYRSKKLNMLKRKM